MSMTVYHLQTTKSISLKLGRTVTVGKPSRVDNIKNWVDFTANLQSKRSFCQLVCLKGSVCHRDVHVYISRVSNLCDLSRIAKLNTRKFWKLPITNMVEEKQTLALVTPFMKHSYINLLTMSHCTATATAS